MQEVQAPQYDWAKDRSITKVLIMMEFSGPAARHQTVAVKVGNVTVELKNVNEKNNRFTVAMVVEDKKFEKKNRAVNEPIFFYTSGARFPEEMVVNKIGKNTVSGYVSIPKAGAQPQASTSTSGM